MGKGPLFHVKHRPFLLSAAPTMDPRALLTELLEQGKVGQPPPVVDALWRYAEELLRWNAKVNLTAITRPDEVVEKHLVDSLLALPEVQGVTSVLDVGAGAGLPGLPLALALPGLEVTLVEAVGKKVAFMKNAIVKLGLVGRVRAVQVHAAGDRGAEQLPLVDLAIARAFTEVEGWVRLAKHYVRPEGRVVAMLGVAPPDEVLADVGDRTGCPLQHCRRYELPRSKERRAVATFGVPARST